MAQLEGSNCWDYLLIFFLVGESCSQRWHSCQPRNCWDYLFNFFWWGNPAASDGTVGREELLGLHLQILLGEILQPEMAQLEGSNCWDYLLIFFLVGESCSQRWHSCQGGTAGIPPLNFPWKIKSQRWLNNIFFISDSKIAPWTFWTFLGTFLAGFQGCTLELFELFELFDPLNFLNFLALQFILLHK